MSAIKLTKTDKEKICEIVDNASEELSYEFLEAIKAEDNLAEKQEIINAFWDDNISPMHVEDEIEDWAEEEDFDEDKIELILHYAEEYFYQNVLKGLLGTEEYAALRVANPGSDNRFEY